MKHFWWASNSYVRDCFGFGFGCDGFDGLDSSCDRRALDDEFKSKCLDNANEMVVCYTTILLGSIEDSNGASFGRRSLGRFVETVVRASRKSVALERPTRN